VPAITDAWVAENVPEAKDTAGLRALVREEGMLYKAQEIEQLKYIGAASELAKRFTATIPDEFYEHTRNELMASLTEQLQLAGKTLEDFYSQQGFGEQEFSMQLMLQTRETLRQGFALDALAHHLKMTVTQDDIEEALERISPNNKEEARQHFDATGRGWQLKEAALRTKANKWLYETATYKSID
ncbi:MAG: hypothetical protein LBB42_01020, partial [Coriobacteriales bacterium]|nr:hypothetical protein [Coriobacteriales bacterium]